MAIVRIVCDASYDDSLRLTGFAGGVQATMPSGHDVYHTYQGVVGEFEDNHLGELAAILVGVKRLNEKIKQGVIEPEAVHIYSDSQTIIDSFAHLHDPKTKVHPRHRVLLRDLAHWLRGLPCDTTFHHVHAHVPEHQATPIERLNIIADKRANDVRNAALNAMLTHNANSNFASMIAPESPNNQAELEAWGVLTERLLSQGKRIRLHIDAPYRHNQHPIVLAATAYCKAHDLVLVEHLRELPLLPGKKPAGLDMTMLRYHVLQEGRDPNFEITNTPSQQRAGLASTLLYGEPYQSLVPMRSPSGRTQPASQVVIDLMRPTNQSKRRPNTVQGFVHTFLSHTPIPMVQGLDAALAFVGLDPEKLAIGDTYQAPRGVQINTRSDIEAAISSVVSTYGDELDRRQLAVKLVDLLREQGFPSERAFSESVMRYVRANRPSTQSTFARRLLRHATKIQAAMPTAAMPTGEIAPSIAPQKKETTLARKGL